MSRWKRNRSNTHPHHAELSRRQLAIFEPAMPSPSTHVAITMEPTPGLACHWSAFADLWHMSRLKNTSTLLCQIGHVPGLRVPGRGRTYITGAKPFHHGRFAYGMACKMTVFTANNNGGLWCHTLSQTFSIKFGWCPHHIKHAIFRHAKFLGCMCALITSDPNPLQLSTIIYHCATDP